MSLIEDMQKEIESFKHTILPEEIVTKLGDDVFDMCDFIRFMRIEDLTKLNQKISTLIDKRIEEIKLWKEAVRVKNAKIFELRNIKNLICGGEEK